MEWQPIETAPKDGRAFLVFICNSFNGPMILSPISRDLNGGWWDDATGDQIEAPNATHWMPLPQPPQEAKP